MRDDTREMATRFLWEALERLPLGTTTSVEDLASACPPLVMSPDGCYGLTAGGGVHDELDLDDLEYDLWSRAEEAGLYVESLEGGAFRLRRRAAVGTALEMHNVSRVAFSTTTFTAPELYMTFELSDGVARIRRGMLSDPVERVADSDVLDAMGAALSAGGVATWDRLYDQPVLDGTTWSLAVTHDDGSVFESHGNNAWPDGFDAFVDGILRIFPDK